MGDWTQPLCEACYVAFMLGRGEAPREPVRMMTGDVPCLICRTPTGIYVRIDPKTTAHLRETVP